MPANLSRIVRRDSDPETLAVAVSGVPPATHAGIVYLGPDRQLHLLHLATHRRVCDWNYTRARSGLICVRLNLEHHEEVALAGWCRRIANAHVNQRTVPYGLQDDEGTRFDPDTLDAILPDGRGMSCATFVVKVFRVAGPRILETDGWPSERPGDRERQECLVRWAETNGDPDFRARADHLRTEVGCPRVRPEEVAGAALEDDLPAVFQDCERNGLMLSAVLHYLGSE